MWPGVRRAALPRQSPALVPGPAPRTGAVLIYIQLNSATADRWPAGGLLSSVSRCATVVRQQIRDRWGRGMRLPVESAAGPLPLRVRDRDETNGAPGDERMCAGSKLRERSSFAVPSVWF